MPGTLQVVLNFLSSVVGLRTGAACPFENLFQNRLFRQIAENVGDVIWMSGTENNALLYVSPAYERIWGRSCESLHRDPRSWLEAICDEDRERVREAARALQSAGACDLEFRIVRPDGAERWIHARTFPVRDERGRIYRAVGLCADVTARHVAQQSARRLAAIVESSDDAILAFSTDLVITEWNRGAERMFGYSAQEAIGRSFGMLHPEERRNEIDAGRAAIDKGLPWYLETKRLRKDGSLIDVALSGAPIRDSTGRLVGYSGIYREITHRKHEEENRILREREMVAVLSHDLRTPLAAIKGFAETLRTGGLDDARRRLSFVRVIERHADRLAGLVDNMLAHSSMESGRPLAAPQAVSLDGFIADHAAGVEPIVAKRQIKLSLELEPLTVSVDPASLLQVFQNIVDNAVKFTPRGGRIAVEARREGLRAHVKVRDSGPGIPMGDLERIFDRFERVSAHSHVKGTGLGLFIAKKIVDAAGGQIWAESVPGRGSCFHFTLPLAENAAPQLKAGLI